MNVNIQQVESIDMRLLSGSLLKAMKKFYADPENERKFREWQASKKEDKKHVRN